MGSNDGAGDFGFIRGLDLTRAVIYAGTPDYANVVLFNPFLTLLAIISLTIIFLVIGTFFFARSEKNR